MEFAVRDDALVAGLTFPDDCGLVLSRDAAWCRVRTKMPIEAVVRDVRLGSDEPLRERRLPVEDLFPRREPGNVLLGHLRPKFCRIGFTELAILAGERLVPMSLLGEFRCRLEGSILLQEGIDVSHIRLNPCWGFRADRVAIALVIARSLNHAGECFVIRVLSWWRSFARRLGLVGSGARRQGALRKEPTNVKPRLRCRPQSSGSRG